MTGTDVGERFLAAYGRADAAAVAELYAEDVVSDINAPRWRFALHGHAAIAEVLDAEEFQSGYRHTGSATRPTPDGAVVEVECRFEVDGEERMAREIHLLRQREGQIVEHVMFCTGIWDAATIRRYRDGADHA